MWHYLFPLCSWREPAVQKDWEKGLHRWTSDQVKISVPRKHPWLLPHSGARLLCKLASSQPAQTQLFSWIRTLIEDTGRDTACCRVGRHGEMRNIPGCCAHIGTGLVIRNESRTSFQLRWSGKRLEKPTHKHTRIGISKHQPWPSSAWLTSYNSETSLSQMKKCKWNSFLNNWQDQCQAQYPSF